MYIQTKTLTLEGKEYEVVINASDKIFLGYDIEIETDIIKKKDDKYIVREQLTWDSLPIYEVRNNEVIEFDYTKYSYFTEMERRKVLSRKIRKQYNPSSELKIIRKTLKTILDYLEIADEGFLKYNNKVESIIKKIPKEKNNG